MRTCRLILTALVVHTCALHAPPVAASTPLYDRGLQYLKDLNFAAAYRQLGAVMRERPDSDEARQACLLRVVLAGAEVKAGMNVLHRYVGTENRSEQEWSDYAWWSRRIWGRSRDVGPMLAADVETLMGFEGSEIKFELSLDTSKLHLGDLTAPAWRQCDLPPPGGDNEAYAQAHLMQVIGDSLAEISEDLPSEWEWRRWATEWPQAFFSGQVITLDGSIVWPSALYFAGEALSRVGNWAVYFDDPSWSRYLPLAMKCFEHVIALETDPASQRRLNAESFLRSTQQHLKHAVEMSALRRPVTSATAAESPGAEGSATNTPAPEDTRKPVWELSGKWTVVGNRLYWGVEVWNSGDADGTVLVNIEWSSGGGCGLNQPLTVAAGSTGYHEGSAELPPDTWLVAVSARAGYTRSILTFDPNWNPTPDGS